MEDQGGSDAAQASRIADNIEQITDAGRLFLPSDAIVH